MPAEIDPDIFHISFSQHISLSSFEIMLKISNQWVGFLRDYVLVSTQNDTIMLGFICSG